MFGSKRNMLCGASIAALILSGAAAITLLASEKNMTPVWGKMGKQVKKAVRQWKRKMS